MLADSFGNECERIQVPQRLAVRLETMLAATDLDHHRAAVRDGALYAIGTLATWAGWLLAVRALWLSARAFGRGRKRAHEESHAALIGTAIAASLLLLAGFALLPASQGSAGIRLPLVWFVMPFAAWCGLLLAAFSAWSTARAVGAIGVEERRGRWVAAAFGAVLAAAFLGYQALAGSKVEMLRGSIPLSPAVIAACVLAGLAAVLVMAGVERAVGARGLAKAAAAHLALVAGSAIFGLPFAWLLVTSFKEDRDMSSPHGIIWVPRVQQTVPYLDPDDPIYETEFEGGLVQGSVLERYPDGSSKIDILTPRALRGRTALAKPPLKQVPKEVPIVQGSLDGQDVTGRVVAEHGDGRRTVEVLSPEALAGRQFTAGSEDFEPVRKVGLRWQNYPDALDYLPPETLRGLVYLKNTLILVVLGVVGTLLSSSVVAYAFARLRFPGRNVLFLVLLSTMMLPAAVTMLPQFLIFRWLGWIDSLYPLWVPAFFGSAFNIFLLRQFFLSVPMELEDAAKIDGCSYLRSFWQVMLPQVKPALAVVAIWTFVAAWNNFMGPLVYVNSPEYMPISYAVQLYQGERGGEPGLLMAFATMSMLPVLALFFFAQKYFIEGVTLTGLGGR